MGWHDHHDHWGGAVAMTLVLIALIALVAWAVYMTVQTRRGPGAGPRAHAQPAGAEAILAERLARGEIDPQEYRDRLSALREVPESGATSEG